MTASTSTVINDKPVAHGDTIITFRGENLTFDYEEDGYIQTKEKSHRLVHRVFVDVKEKS